MTSSYDGRAVVVAGAGVSGVAAARALRARGAEVTVVDADPVRRDRLGGEGFAVLDTALPPPGTTEVITSPGWRPTSPLLLAARAAGIPVIGEVELARRISGPDGPDWLAVTGTNGKTTTTILLEAVLRAAGLRTVAAGNIGLPLVEAVTGHYDVLAVELSSFQLHWSPAPHPHTAALLNVADDHLDWHGSVTDYALTKARVWDGAVAVGNLDDPVTAQLLAHAPGRQVGFTLTVPRAGQLGLVEDLLVDRAFPDVEGEATELATLGDLALQGPQNVANALAAAALARSYGVPAEAVRAGLSRAVAGAHRNALVLAAGGVSWVDDSKATNAHAAAASLGAYDSVVWIAGGLLKGAQVDELVAAAASRLRGVVLIGADQGPFSEALARHAPDVPVVTVSRLDTDAMDEAVTAARRLAAPGDTVLLAPAAASMDIFRDYAERGDLFAVAATRHAGPA